MPFWLRISETEMNEQDLLYTIALSKVPYLNAQHLCILLDELGNATQVYEHRLDILSVLPQASPRLQKALAQLDELIPKEEEELRFAQTEHIQCLTRQDKAYPQRLKECPDAPIVMYYRGTSDLNSKHIVSVVGTRQITEYGKDLCHHFCKDLSQILPDSIVVSGLAYGVDIHAQRAALECGLETIGVVAHGLDTIYPLSHRSWATKMQEQGGLLTEFPSKTIIDKHNFVQRNRIVAGISSATIVIESASKGGSLITAEIANSYNRDVFAFPGRVKDIYSEGCNDLIRKQKAQLITSAEDFVSAVGWFSDVERKKKLQEGAQQEFLPMISEKEQRIIDALKNSDGKQVNLLCVQTNLPVGELSGLLFELEMKGVVKMLSGGVYRLLS